MRRIELTAAISLFAAVAGDSIIVPAVPVHFGPAPASAYWIAVGVALVFSGLCRRAGQARLLAIGAALTGAGLTVTACAVGSPSLAIAGRAVTGLGIGVAMLAAQDVFLSVAGPDRTATATARYLGVYFAGMVVGFFTGGFLVGRYGVGGASLAGAVLALAGGLVALTTKDTLEKAAEAQPLTWRLGARFPTFLVLAALPTRAVNGGLIYALPLLLATQGQSPQTIATVATAYPAAMLFCPLAGRRLDGRTAGASTVGQVFSAGALLVASAVLAAHEHAVAVAVAASLLLGIGQIIAMPAQTSVALASALPLPRPAALGIYRACERVGLAAGPMAVGCLSGFYGLPGALRTLAAASVAAAILFNLISLSHWCRR